MGFDLSGLNPNVTRPQPVLPPFTERTNKHWEEYYEWQEENCGTYFRNNVWWWSPLWSYVAKTCSDIISVADANGGTNNGGHKISKTKAKRIAKRLRGLERKGEVDVYANSYKNNNPWVNFSYNFSTYFNICTLYFL